MSKRDISETKPQPPRSATSFGLNLIALGVLIVTLYILRRYEQHLATGQPLPSETVAYVAAVMPLLADEQSEHAAFPIRRAIPWREAPLFVDRADAP